MLATNQVLHKGRYRIINLFDQDVNGGLYEALDTESNTNVVLRETVGTVGKVATVNQLREINAVFAGRAEMLKEARHDSLVSVQDYFSEIDRQYLVLEPMTGNDLAKVIAAGAEPPPMPQVLSWMDQILSALTYLHGLSPAVIHGEIRPRNIKLTSGNKVKLLIDRVPVNPNAAAKGSFDDETLAYRPLEQIWTDLDETSQRVIFNSYDERSAGELLRAPDARSDIYSFAATFYHVLTGSAPADALDRSIAILDGNPDTLQPPSSIPPEIADTLMKALSIRREHRLEAAAVIQQVLLTAVVPMTDSREVTASSPEATNGPELEPKHSDQRQLEIEAEQARLDEERKRIEQRQMELAAEQERHAAERERLRIESEQERQRLEKVKLEEEAEKERQRIARLTAELEAERAKKRAEDERLEREAEAERHRAEERLREIHAEQERHRTEQLNLEIEAKKELERAEQRLKELSAFHLDTVEPVKHDNGADISDPGFAPPFEPDTVAANDPFETYDTAVPEFLEQPGFNWRVPVIIAAAALVLGGSAVVWNMISSGPAEESPAVLRQQAVLPIQDPSPAQGPSQTIDAVQPAAAVTTMDPAANTPMINDRPKTAQTQISSTSVRQQKPAPAPPAAAKKKVTVDDLINDN